VAHAVAFARIAEVEHLLLFHHDPLHTDDHLRSLEAHAREVWGDHGVPPELAREGMTLPLNAEVEAPS
jgi:hypothetical protein